VPISLLFQVRDLFTLSSSRSLSPLSPNTLLIACFFRVHVLDSPWFIVTTSHDNTFYYNKETKTSIWIPTPELEILLAKIGQVETEKRKAEADRLAKEEQDRLSAAAVGTKRSNEENLSKENAEKRPKTDNSTAGQDTNVGTE